MLSCERVKNSPYSLCALKNLATQVAEYLLLLLYIITGPTPVTMLCFLFSYETDRRRVEKDNTFQFSSDTKVQSSTTTTSCKTHNTLYRNVNKMTAVGLQPTPEK